MSLAFAISLNFSIPSSMLKVKSGGHLSGWNLREIILKLSPMSLLEALRTISRVRKAVSRDNGSIWVGEGVYSHLCYFYAAEVGNEGEEGHYSSF